MTEMNKGIPAVVRLHEALDAAGLPVAGVGREKGSDALRVDWREPPSKAQVEQTQRILTEFDPAPSKTEHMARAGFGAECLLAALWKKVVEGDGALVEEIQEKMGSVKQSIS